MSRKEVDETVLFTAIVAVGWQYIVQVSVGCASEIADEKVEPFPNGEESAFLSIARPEQKTYINRTLNVEQKSKMKCMTGQTRDLL